MNKIITHNPDKWVILKIPENYYKVFATWIGGYEYGDAWRVNSGITNVEQDEEFYYFHGYSGSCYKCNKKHYGTSTSGHIMLGIITQNSKIEILDDCEDFQKLIVKTRNK